MYNTENQVSVVTGAASGLGNAIANGLVDKCRYVVIMDLPEKIDELNEKVVKEGNQHKNIVSIPVDLREVQSIAKAFANTMEMFGRIDILVNNAGVNILCPFLNTTEYEWDYIHSVNLKGTFFCSKEAARYMIRQREGSIINIASQFGVVGYNYRSAYSASKAGVIGLTRTMAVELAHFGIRVNSISPTILHKESNSWLIEKEEFRQEILPKIPLGRFAELTDIVGAVTFLTSNDSGMITGHNLMIDGGWTAM